MFHSLNSLFQEPPSKSHAMTTQARPLSTSRYPIPITLKPEDGFNQQYIASNRAHHCSVKRITVLQSTRNFTSLRRSWSIAAVCYLELSFQLRGSGSSYQRLQLSSLAVDEEISHLDSFLEENPTPMATGAPLHVDTDDIKLTESCHSMLTGTRADKHDPSPDGER